MSGHVLSADTGRPIPRARVSASLAPRADAAPATGAAQGGSSFATITDHAGAFVLSELPAGEYTLTAAKTAYLSMSYGARRPQRPGRRVSVKQGQQVRDLDVRLPRGSVLTGRVYDEGGEPIVRAMVQAMRTQYVQGEPRLSTSGSATTDDRGQYRIFGLMPGAYVVSASARLETAGDSEGRAGDQTAAQTYAPTYYPGVMSTADAVSIPLGLQQEFASADFMLQTVPAARVSGTVVGESAGLAGTMLVLVIDDPRGVAAGGTYGGRVQEDGSFTVAGVPPGRYLAIAQGAAGPAPRRVPGVQVEARTWLVGIQPVSVSGQDVTGITIALSSGGTMAGWVTFESAGGQRADLNQLRLGTIPPVALPGIRSETARVQPDGSFTISNLAPGSHLLRLNNPPRGWALKGIFQNGREVSDQALDVRSGQTTGGLQVVLTDRVTSIAGTVTDPGGSPVSDCYVVLFPADPAGWRPRSRLVQGGRPDSAGAYRFSGVPPGEYHLAVVGDLEPGSWYDPALLGELSKTATRVSVEEGDTKTVTLKDPAGSSTGT